jgi:hypothetical protein
LPTSKSAITFNFVSNVGTPLDLLEFSTHFTDMDTKFLANISRTKYAEKWFKNLLPGTFLVD